MSIVGVLQRARPIRMRGSIVFESPTYVAPPATVRLRLIEVAAADAPSRDLAEYEMTPESPGTFDRLSFDIQETIPDSTHNYYLIAGFRTAGGGRELAVGDQTTVSAYPLNTAEDLQEFELKLQTV